MKYSIFRALRRGSVVASALLAAAGLYAASAPAAYAQADNPNLIMLAGPLWDPFFGAVKQGADDAAKNLGANYQWVTSTDANNFAADYAKLVRQSASRKPDVLIVGNYFPATLDPIIKEITASGMPVIIQHDGGGSWQEDGAIGYVGFDAVSLGHSVARHLIDAGSKKGLCVNHVPGNTTLENECKGFDAEFQAAGGSSTVLTIQFSDANNQTFVANAIKGALQADPAIDGVWTIGAVQGVASTVAIDQLGKTGQIKNGSLGLSLGSLQALKDGKLLFIADLQPYLMGYYAVLSAYQYAKYGVLPLGTVPTGPMMVTPENVDKIIALNTKYPGIRGAS
jgi:simple sugar transport system substrate-binding protein